MRRFFTSLWSLPAQDAVLARMKEQGEIDRLYRRHTGRTLTQWLHYARPIDSAEASKTP
jgi:polar amino acid transport system substrate-binding protein